MSEQLYSGPEGQRQAHLQSLAEREARGIPVHPVEELLYVEVDLPDGKHAQDEFGSSSITVEDGRVVGYRYLAGGGHIKTPQWLIDAIEQRRATEKEE